MGHMRERCPCPSLAFSPGTQGPDERLRKVPGEQQADGKGSRSVNINRYIQPESCDTAALPEPLAIGRARATAPLHKRTLGAREQRDLPKVA